MVTIIANQLDNNYSQTQINAFYTQAKKLIEDPFEFWVFTSEQEESVIFNTQKKEGFLDDIQFHVPAYGGNWIEIDLMQRTNKGDTLLFDFGATYQGYNADITRTFFIIEADEYQIAAYNNVLEANKVGIKNSILSKTMHDVDNETTLILENGEYNNFIVHKTGHGLGLDVHEDPYIVRGNNSPLEIGMIITVEPGLYLPGKFGIRIEDDVVITDKDPNVLTSFSKDLRIINNE